MTQTAERTEGAVVLSSPSAPAQVPAMNMAASLIGVITKAASDPTVDVSKLQALLDMQERIMERQAVIDFNTAVASLPPLRVARNGTVSLGSNKGSFPFAKWEDMDAIIRQPMLNAGLSLSFDSKVLPDGRMLILGKLLHASGHFRTAEVPLPLDNGPGRNSLQAMGSTLSYGKRYCAEMLLNVVRFDQDDDGVSGGTKYITFEDARALDELIARAKVNRAEFLRRFNVGENLLDMRGVDVGPAFDAIEGELRKQQADQQRQQAGSSKLNNIEKEAVKAGVTANDTNANPQQPAGQPSEDDAAAAKHQRLLANGAKWLEHTLKRVENAQHIGDLEAMFGTAKKPELGNETDRKWAAWLKSNDKPAFDRLQSVYRPKFNELSSAQKRNAA